VANRFKTSGINPASYERVGYCLRTLLREALVVGGPARRVRVPGNLYPCLWILFQHLHRSFESRLRTLDYLCCPGVEIQPL
jgi:hypothetical protein